MATASHAEQNTGLSINILSWLSWTHFLNDGIANYLPGVLPFILTERHVPEALAGSFMTALLLGQSLQPLSGWIADRIGGRSLVLGGVVLSTVAAAMVGFSHPIWLILSFLLLTGIGNTAFHPQALSITRTHVGKRQGLGMAVFLVGGEIGRSLGPLAAGLVVHHYGLQWIWLLAVPLILTYPWIVKAIPAQPKRTNQRPPIAFDRHIKPASALLAYALVRSATIYEIITLAPIMWHKEGGSLVTGAALVSVLIGVGIIGNLGGGGLNDRIGKRFVLFSTSLLAILSLMAFNTLHGVWIWPTLGIMGIALFGASSTTTLIGQDIFSENPALGSGVALGLANGLGAIMVIPLTYVAAQTSDALTVWILIALTLITIPTIMAMPVHHGTRHA